jgi:hypothetical protein
MTDVEALRGRLGLPAAPLVIAGLEATCRFFHDVLHEDPLHWCEYLRGIDFHQLVRTETLPGGMRLSQHQYLETDALKRPAPPKPFVYFTVPGVSPTATGTTFASSRFVLYQTQRPTAALVSFASPMSFNDLRAQRIDRVSRMGGGKQFIIALRDAPPLLRVGT